MGGGGQKYPIFVEEPHLWNNSFFQTKRARGQKDFSYPWKSYMKGPYAVLRRAYSKSVRCRRGRNEVREKKKKDKDAATLGG